MPLQNRVTPEGDIVATPARGAMFGNRGGCFHHPDQTLRRRHWASRQWICCVLVFKNRRRRPLMQPGRYTELFFLDEATAFAAGHRPCFECRRDAAVDFAGRWAGATALPDRPPAPLMDAVLHAERLDTAGGKRTQRMPLAALPAGVFVRWQGSPHLVGWDRLARWSFAGYGEPIERPRSGDVDLLTPPTIAAIISAGYRPKLHASAAGMLACDSKTGG